MTHRSMRAALAVAALSPMPATAYAQSAPAPIQPAGGPVVEGQYIVVLEYGTSPTSSA